ncbi:T9SS C-terminal target domain-containing protein [Fibrisoma montanum]|uniref:T9SS C-terminal target domain-containing protein n=1 Tax=Fibrisoma montanum TaxID=2305895 RepID=A0A418MJT1_9BACT|nr:two-component regulator propeller domain-containing protein [Fibrisoma montanum]RIV27748.1 T9SS C-terminal target domain-containing protein [Fibrisoma montanum]
MNDNGALVISRRAGWLGALLSFIVHTVSLAQIGTWQTHVSYRSAQSVAIVGGKVYAASLNGFFYYDKASGGATTLTKQSGLSDVGISRIIYLNEQQRLLIAYRNGNLDFLSLSETGEPGDVKNVNTIAVAQQLPTARSINHINRVGNTAYLSTDFGVVVLDLTRDEIRDTYFSRTANGQPEPIYQTAATTDSLYALVGLPGGGTSDLGMRAVRLAPAVNLADPANWRSIPRPGPLTLSIVSNQGRLFATASQQGIFERQAGRWTLTQALTDTTILQFAGPDGLLLVTDNGVRLLNGTTLTSPLLSAFPREAVADGANRVWVADLQNGLLDGQNGTFTPIGPEGPSQDQFAGLYAYPQTLVALPSATQVFSAEAFSVANGRWQGLTISGFPSRFTSAAYIPAEQRVYFGSNGRGLWSQAEGEPLTPVPLPASIGNTINSLSADVNGDLWITTSATSTLRNVLHVRRADGQFNSFNIGSQLIEQVVVADNGYVWMRLSSFSGILVFDPATNRTRFLDSGPGTGNLPSSGVRSIAKDRDGAIWVGTDLGVTVFDNPSAVLDGRVDANPPILNRRRLLANEPITSLVVDGGNRKWIGTQNGLYRVSPDGSQLLETFTVATSPLPSNAIRALAIEPVSGGLFVATDQGLISYRGTATEPAEQLSGLTIFPNPVRPDFGGTVGINGLTDNATVKIVDAGGQLVYETRSEGGTASWNLRDYRGRSAQTGIYLVIVVGRDGVEGVAGKLAVVR